MPSPGVDKQRPSYHLTPASDLQMNDSRNGWKSRLSLLNPMGLYPSSPLWESFLYCSPGHRGIGPMRSLIVWYQFRWNSSLIFNFYPANCKSLVLAFLSLAFTWNPIASFNTRLSSQQPCRQKSKDTNSAQHNLLIYKSAKIQAGRVEQQEKSHSSECTDSTLLNVRGAWGPVVSMGPSLIDQT